jgi:hypothetical protein
MEIHMSDLYYLLIVAALYAATYLLVVGIARLGAHTGSRK